MKKIFLTLLIAATTSLMFTSCNKDEIKPNESSVNTLIDYNPQGANARTVTLGSIVSDSAANVHIARFITVSPDWPSNFRLNRSNYDLLASLPGAVGIGFHYAHNEGLIITAIDENGLEIDSIYLAGNSTGGAAITAANAKADIQLFDSLDNQTAGHPGVIMFNFEIMDDIMDHESVEGLSISNAYLLDKGKDYVDLVIKGYDSESLEVTDIVITTGAKDCGVLMGGYYWTPCMNCLAVWVPSYWVSCDQILNWMVPGGI